MSNLKGASAACVHEKGSFTYKACLKAAFAPKIDRMVDLIPDVCSLPEKATGEVYALDVVFLGNEASERRERVADHDQDAARDVRRRRCRPCPRAVDTPERRGDDVRPEAELPQMVAAPIDVADDEVDRARPTALLERRNLLKGRQTGDELAEAHVRPASHG